MYLLSSNFIDSGGHKSFQDAQEKHCSYSSTPAALGLSAGRGFQVFSMDGFEIPWSCLQQPHKVIDNEQNTTKQTKSFAQVVKVNNNFCNIPTSKLPQPIIKGNKVAISIPKDKYLAGLIHVNIIFTVTSFGQKGQLC